MKIFRAESKEILDKVCSENERNVTYSSRMVPFKKRCGVKNKNIINMDNKCHCTEANNRGVGKNTIIKRCCMKFWGLNYYMNVS